MKLQGTYSKDGKFWLSEIALIDLMDQGKTKAGSLKMIKEAVELLINKDGFTCEVKDLGHGEFILSSNDAKTLISFVLKRLRESEGLTIREVGERLGHRSHTEYARHESGQTAMTFETFNKYVSAISNKDLVLKIA